MIKTLVTGGAGFLGSHLCKNLIANNHEVICLDNFYTGSLDNIKDLIDSENFQLINHDITIPINLEVDEIYNLACPASPIHYQHDPVQTIKTNIHGAINTLELAKQLKCKIFHSSTSEIYGDPEQHPQTEEYWGRVNPIGIRSCYDEGKRCAETLFFDYKRQYNLDIKVARIFNTYGPNMSVNDGRVVSNFIVQALKSEDITVFGDGTQTRSFCYVDDLIEGFIKFMSTQESGPINLGNTQEMSINEIARFIINEVGSNSKIKYVPLPQDDPLQRKPDISMAKKNLLWEPKVSLEEGMTKTIKYFQNIIS